MCLLLSTALDLLACWMGQEVALAKSHQEARREHKWREPGGRVMICQTLFSSHCCGRGCPDPASPVLPGGGGPFGSAPASALHQPGAASHGHMGFPPAGRTPPCQLGTFLAQVLVACLRQLQESDPQDPCRGSRRRVASNEETQPWPMWGRSELRGTGTHR